MVTEKDLVSSSGVVAPLSGVVATPIAALPPPASAISTARGPTSLVQPSTRSSAPAAALGANLVDDAAQQREQHARDALEKSQLARKPKPLPPQVQKDSATFKAKFAQAKANTMAGSQQQQQQQQQLPPQGAHACSRDAVCHCLVVDVSMVPAALKVNVDQVLALTVQASIEVHGRVLLHPHIPSDDISSIYIPREAKTIHINFVSLAALGAALRHPALPFLIRCGSTAMSRWNQYTKACGPSRDQLPELIRFSYTSPAAVNVEVATKDMAVKLKQLGVVYTFLDVRSQPLEEDRAGVGGRGRQGSGGHRLAGMLLPRDILTAHVLSIIEKLHGTIAVGGHTIRAHGPNSSATNRCNQCEQLGHMSKECALYDGLAVRFIFQRPVPYHFLRGLVKDTTARDGFLGSSIDDRRPSRRVTLLFDGEQVNEDRDGRLAVVSVAVALCLPSFQSLLAPHSPDPEIINIKDRTTECRECGSTQSPHECPFVVSFAHAGVASVAGAAGPRGLGFGRSQPHDNMCLSWRSKKICPRLLAGQYCKHTHPDSHIVDTTCYQYQRAGRCARGDACQFTHASRQQQPAVPAARVSATVDALPVAAAVPAVASASALVAVPAATTAAASSIAASLAASPSASPPRSNKKRTQRSSANAEADSTPAAAAASSSPMDIDANGDAATAVTTSTDVLVTPPRDNKKVKKQGAATTCADIMKHALAGFPVSPSRWGDAEDDDEEADEEEEKSIPPATVPAATVRTLSRSSSSVSSRMTTATATTPASSLGSLSSPGPPLPHLNRPQSFASPAKRGGRGGATGPSTPTRGGR